MTDGVTESTATTGEGDQRPWWSPGNLVRLAWAGRQFILALLVLVIAVLLLWDAYRGRPVAASFTQVGGPTRVETAVEASRFWLEPPTQVVTTPARGRREISGNEIRVDEIRMGAARCAVRHDAPLLLTSTNRKRQVLVDQTIDRWRRKGGALEVIDIWNEDDVSACLSRSIPGLAEHLSTLGMPDNREPDPQLTIPEVDAGQLEPTIVFAPPKSVADHSFVAVGLALAAHMARKDRPVSLVVIPRYMEADPKLEEALRKRRRQVEGGIVLGPTEVMPEDTRDVLRQVLAATGRSGVLGALQGVLGSLDTLLAAILALLGAGAVSEGVEKFKRRGREGAFIMPTFGGSPKGPPDGTPSDTSALPAEREPTARSTPTVTDRAVPRSGTATSVVILCLIPPAILAAGWFLRPVWAWITIMLLLLAFVIFIGRHIVGLWRGAFVDGRNKVSLSRFQAVLWTVLVIAGFLAAALFNVREDQRDPLGIAVPEQLWILLGISGTALVGSSLIKSQKRTANTAKEDEAKAKMGPEVTRLENTNLFVAAADPDNPAPTDPVVAQGVLTVNPHPKDSRWSDMFEAEEVGNKDHLALEKIQMFYFTIILVLAYAAAMAAIFADPSRKIGGLPLLDDSMVALLGISHATYLTGKAIPRTTTR
jgi:hypothetical protein